MAAPLTPERWARLDAALEQLLDLLPAQRAAAVERLAAGDADFARELEALASHLDDTAWLDAPALPHRTGDAPAPTPGPASLPPGTRVGDWRLVAPLGRGGMGEVWSAERADGQFEQSVAIKVLRLEAGAQWAHFEAERRILARLEHPHIARLLDGGLTGDGRPFMVMELVAGEPVTHWCEHRASGLPERLAAGGASVRRRCSVTASGASPGPKGGAPVSSSYPSRPSA